MTIAEREQQIIRVKSQSFQSEMVSELENTLLGNGRFSNVIKEDFKACWI
jgi:hypothetical protein